MNFMFTAIFLVFILQPALYFNSVPLNHKLHFPKTKREFFSKIKVVEALLNIPLNNDINGLWTLLKAKKAKIKTYLTGTTLTGLDKTPVFQRKEYLLKVVSNVFSSLDFIKNTFVKLTTRPSKREIKVETPETCEFSLKVFDANLSTDLIAFTHYLTKIEENIAVNTRTVALATNFVISTNYEKVNSYFESAIAIAENWQKESNEYVDILKSLLTARELHLSQFKKLTPKAEATNCLSTAPVNAKQILNVEECTSGVNAFTCNLIAIIAESPKFLYEMYPLVFNSCYVDKVFFTDGENNYYKTICNKNFPNFSCYSAIKLTSDLCLNGLKMQNSTMIKANCELKRSTLEFETGFHGLVVHRLTDQSKIMLKNLKVKIPEAPFQIIHGALDLKIYEETYTYNYVKEMILNTPKPDFSREELCPPLPTFLDTTWEIFMQGLYPALAVMAAQSVLFGSIFGLYKLTKYVIHSCKDKKKKASKRFDSRLNEILLEEIQPRRSRRRNNRRRP